MSVITTLCQCLCVISVSLYPGTRVSVSLITLAVLGRSESISVSLQRRGARDTRVGPNSPIAALHFGQYDR
eukprot:3662719-Rhodomonas_salina.1